MFFSDTCGNMSFAFSFSRDKDRFYIAIWLVDRDKLYIHRNKKKGGKGMNIGEKVAKGVKILAEEIANTSVNKSILIAAYEPEITENVRTFCEKRRSND